MAYNWKQLRNLIYLQAHPKVIVKDGPDGAEIKTQSKVVVSGISIDTLLTATIEIRPKKEDKFGFFVDLTQLVMIFPRGTLPELPSRAIPGRLIILESVSMSGLKYVGEYEELPSILEEPSLTTRLLATVDLDPVSAAIMARQDMRIYPIAFNFGAPKIPTLSYDLGRETLALLAFHLGTEDKMVARLAQNIRLMEFDSRPDPIYLQRFYEFTGFDPERLKMASTGRVGLNLAFTGSAMAYVGGGGSLETYADSDIDVYYFEEVNPKPISDPPMKSEIERFLTAMGWNPEELVETGINHYQFAIPGGRQIDFYHSSHIQVWSHHVAPARMHMRLRDLQFQPSPSAFKAYSTKKIDDLKFILSQKQTPADIIRKYVRRGYTLSGEFVGLNLD